jgi:single-strand DNA-binding protein
MKMALCKATLIGNVGRDPDQRYTQAGKPMVNFSVACNRVGPPTESGERREETEWFTVLCFGRLAEVAGERVSKGSRVYVEGRLQTRSFEARDGQTRFVVEVVANELQVLSPRQPREMGEPGMVGMAPVAAGMADADNLDDVPF